MIRKFDHAMITVRNLDETIARYRNLGFEVQPGGHHPEIGTHNALIYFRQDFIELISVHNESKTKALPLTSGLLNFLAAHEGGLTMYALATTDIQQEAEHLRASHLTAMGPFPAERVRPDGQRLRWRLLIANGAVWCQPCPFFIQRDIPDEQDPAWGQSGTHPNGVTGCKGIAIAVRDLEQMANLYQHQFGLELIRRDEVPALASLRATFRVGSFEIDLLAPYGEGPVQHVLDTVGETPFELRLAVSDLEQTRAFFSRQNLSYESDPVDPARVLLTPQQTLGARLVFTAQNEQ